MSNPTECTLIHGNPFPTLEQCQTDLEYVGVPYVEATYGDNVYISGIDCLSVSFRDEAT